MKTIAARLILASSLAAEVSLAGCGGDGNLLVPVVDTVYQHQRQFTGLARFGILAADFSVPAAGTLNITTDWMSPADDIDLVLSNPACDAVALSGGLCKVLATELSNLKPAQLTLPTTATGYRLFVINRGPSDESGTILITVTQRRLGL